MQLSVRASLVLAAALSLLACDAGVEADKIRLQQDSLIVSVSGVGEQSPEALNKVSGAICPDGYTVVGGGYNVRYEDFQLPADHIVVTSSAPARDGIEDGPPNSWRVFAFQPEDTGIPWTLTAYAQCFKWRPRDIAVVPDIDFPSNENVAD